MSKKKEKVKTKEPLVASILPTMRINFKIQALVLIIIGFVFYANSFKNEYALDDGILVQKNDYVLKGFAGIPTILTTDSYDSFYRQMNAKQQLSGGRYRPLSVVTFAIEEQFFGSKEKVKPADDVAFVRHVVNVVLYILSIVILLYFLQNFIFRENPLVAFITCFIFLIHPLHTEVVANVKSRDEILSFTFIILTFISAFRYRETKNKKQLLSALCFYFLAYLSKEYAITLLLLIPMLLVLVKGDAVKESIYFTIPFLVITVLYLFLRLKIVGVGSTIENPDVLNSPFKFATNSEKWATKIEILNHYLRLLLYPDPLSSDYSYNSIPYKNFGNILVWLSIVIHISMIWCTVWLFKKRNILAFGLAFYLLHLALISNLLLNIGATMGERLVYHSSLGFAMAIALLANWLLKKIAAEKIRNSVSIALGCIILIWCGTKTIARNAEWKNDTILFIADAKKVPYSALVNGNAGKAYIDLSEKPENKAQEKELVEKAIFHLSRAVDVHKQYVNGYLNLGVAYFKLKDYDKTKEVWEIARQLYPNNPYVLRNFGLLAATYYNQAMTFGPKEPEKAIVYLNKSLEIDPSNVNAWYDLGGAYYTLNNYQMARQAWAKAVELKPDFEKAKQGLEALPK